MIKFLAVIIGIYCVWRLFRKARMFYYWKILHSIHPEYPIYLWESKCLHIQIWEYWKIGFHKGPGGWDLNLGFLDIWRRYKVEFAENNKLAE